MKHSDMKPVSLIFFIWIGLQPVYAQDEEESMQGMHRISLGLGHTQTPEGRKGDKTEWIAMPSWSLDYDYWFGRRWGVGVQSDMVLEAFVIKTSDGEELERTRPVSLVPLILYKPFRHFTFMAGGGEEFSSEKNLYLTRLAVECGFPLARGWETSITVIWDDKWKNYNSFNITVGFSKLLHR